MPRRKLIKTAQLRQNLPDILQEVEQGERFLVQHYNDSVAALVSVRDLQVLQAQERSMKVITVYNWMGGCGKSTVSRELAYQLAQQKHRVLLVDFDPQADLTEFLGYNPDDLSDEDCPLRLMDDVDLQPMVLHVDDFGFDFVPTKDTFQDVENGTFENLLNIGNNLHRYAEQQEYDFVVIDSVPSGGVLATVALHRADFVLIPMQPTIKGFRSLRQNHKKIKRVRGSLNRSLEILGYVITERDNRQAKIQKEVLTTLEETVPPEMIFNGMSKLPGVYERALQQGMPVGALSEDSALQISRAQEECRNLADFVLSRVKAGVA